MSSALTAARLADRGSLGAPAHIVRAVEDASRQTGADFSYLLEKAAVESGYQADAKAKTSSATGLFQFIESTWLTMVERHGGKYGLDHYADAIETGRNGRLTVADPNLRREILDLRKDPETAALLAGELAQENKTHLETVLGREPNKTELYLAHFLGTGGAGRFLKALERNPERSGAELLPEAARANRNVFFERNGQPKSLAEIYDRFAAKFADAGPNDLRAAAAEAVDAVRMPDRKPLPQVASKAPPPGTPLSTFTVTLLNSLAPPLEQATSPRAAAGGREEDRNQVQLPGALFALG